MRIAIVTSFNKLLYEYYAHRFLHSYNWEFDLHIYHEGWTPSDFDIRDNIHYIDINSGKNGNQLRRFQNKVGYYNVASTVNGRPDKIIHGTDYKKDAIRFSYKVFAKTDFILKSHISNSYDYVFWIDADVIFKKPISKRDVIEKFLPKEYAISFIHRPTYYSECGFVGYNLTHDSTINFVRKFREQYTSLQLVKEKEWHDSSCRQAPSRPRRNRHGCLPHLVPRWRLNRHCRYRRFCCGRLMRPLPPGVSPRRSCWRTALWAHRISPRLIRPIWPVWPMPLMPSGSPPRRAAFAARLSRRGF